MKINLNVPLWIIIAIVALPQLCETIYAASLPDLAINMHISENTAQYTLTVYLIGFAIGVLIWGNLSDRLGRKPGLLLGLIIYFFASIGCWFSESITILMLFRFLQSLGISAGSVLGQAIARDTITAERRGSAFSTISMAMAFAPAIGSMFGGLTIQYLGWSSVFIVLASFSSLLISQIIFKLPETNKNIVKHSNIINLITRCLKKMVMDKRVVGLGFLVGGVNGILFGYFVESPFYFIEMLGMELNHYSIMSFYIVFPLMLGGAISKYLHTRQIKEEEIILYGCVAILLGGLGLLMSVSLKQIVNFNFLPIVSVLWTTCVMIGTTMIIPNCLSRALEDYSQMAGTAASLFGFYYYIIISLITSLMSYMHNGTVYQMPIFFLIIGTTMCLVWKYTLSFQKDKDLISAEKEPV